MAEGSAYCDWCENCGEASPERVVRHYGRRYFVCVKCLVALVCGDRAAWEAVTDCAQCGRETGELEVFPGHVCLECWAGSPDGRRMPTGADVRALWGLRP